MRCFLILMVIIRISLNDVNGQSLALRFDDEFYYRGENFSFHLDFTNETGHSVNFITNPILATNSGQIQFLFDSEFPVAEFDPKMTVTYTTITNRFSTVSVNDLSSFKWDIPGETIAEAICDYGATNVRARVMIGDYTFVTSNVAQIMMGEWFSDHRERIVCNTAYRDVRMVLNPLVIYNMIHNQDSYCLTRSGFRLCKFTTNEVPSFAMNTNAAILTVTLPVSRKTVRYYPRTGRIEEESMP